MFALLATLALAQNTDQEYVAPDAKASGAGHLDAGFEFESEAHSFNNMDLRPLDESSDQAILDSDDRGMFAYTGVGVDLAYSPAADMEFDLAASHRGLWGNDQIGGTNRFGGWVYVSGLSFDWTPVAGSEENSAPGLRLRFGRQYYSIGGPNRKDYILADVIDGIRIDAAMGGIGHVEVIPFSVVAAAGDPADANFVGYLGQGTTQLYGMRGDHVTTRYGANVALDGLVDGLDLRAYTFYTDIAAIGSGADISYDGLLGNFSDNDYVVNYGLRAGFEKNSIAVWGEFAGSAGVDRKELVAQDVNTNGFAWGAGGKFDNQDDEGNGFDGGADYWEAQGPSYTGDGMMYSHGYVSMKGSQVGGLVTDRFLGWHPSAYVGMFGIDNNPHDKDRKSGTRVIHAGAEYGLKGVQFGADGWFLFDTGVTALDFDDLDSIVPPYGYSRAEFAAERRLGADLGIEVDGHVNLRANDHLSFNVVGGLFRPGAYYGTVVDRVAGTQLGGLANAWDVGAGLEVEF